MAPDTSWGLCNWTHATPWKAGFQIVLSTFHSVPKEQQWWRWAALPSRRMPAPRWPSHSLWHELTVRSTLELLRMLWTFDCITARKRHCICSVPWSLLGKWEPSLDIWEAGSPCCASVFPPAPKAVELGPRPALSYTASSERTGAGTRLLVHAWCCVFMASSRWVWGSHAFRSLSTFSTYLSMTVGNSIQSISWEKAPSKRKVLCVRSQS